MGRSNNAAISKAIVTGAVIDPNDQPTGDTGSVGGVAIPTTQTFYDASGRVWKSIDENGLESQTVYDTRGFVIQTKDQTRDTSGTVTWNETRTTYDDSGRVVYSSDSYVSGTAIANIYGTLTEYDSSGRVTAVKRVKSVDIQVVGALGAQTASINTPLPTVVSTSTTTYDSVTQRVSKTTDNFGRETQLYYDQFGQIVESRIQTRSFTSDAGGGTGTDQWLVTRTVFDSNGRVIFTSDPYTTTSATALGAAAGNSPTVYGTPNIL